MAVVFRLSGVAGDADNRTVTVSRMQKLENCLSGYYAVFGSYPQVPLQGASRNIFSDASDNNAGIQSDDPNDVDDSELRSASVKAACKAQPVAAIYPPPGKVTIVKNGNKQTVTSEEAYQNFKDAVQAAYDSDYWTGSAKTHVERLLNRQWIDISSNPGTLNSSQNETSCNQLQLFRFGLMSFLLPRYRFMLDCAKGSQSGSTEAFNNAIDRFRQWTENNPLPPKMDTGISFSSWKEFCDTMGGEDDWQIDLIPSQAACARWLPNLRDIVSGRTMSFFGVDVGSSGNSTGIPQPRNADTFMLYSPGDNGGSSGSGYPLLSSTVNDGWGEEFYYYSPSPYQSYVLWSSGANRETFPPWVDLEQFKNDYAKHYETAVKWMADDVKFMSTGK
jgi:hypothetical protein